MPRVTLIAPGMLPSRHSSRGSRMSMKVTPGWPTRCAYLYRSRRGPDRGSESADLEFRTREPELRQPLLEVVAEQRFAHQIGADAAGMLAVAFAAHRRPFLHHAVAAAEPQQADQVGLFVLAQLGDEHANL